MRTRRLLLGLFGVTALGMTVFAGSLAAQSGCQTDDPPCPPDQPPVIGLYPGTGTFGTATVTVSVYFDDDHGLAWSTVASPVTIPPENQYIASGFGTGQVTLQPGPNTFTASICDWYVPAHCVSQTVVYTYTPPPPPPSHAAPTISLAPHNGENRDIGRCVAGCFENTLAYATSAYTSLDSPRRVALVYSRAQGMTKSTLQVDATDISAEPTVKMSLLLKRPDQTWVTFTNGSSEIFFQSGSGTTRLAAQFDVTGLPTGAYDYTVVARSWWADNSFLESTAPIKVLVLREDQSPYGYGWWIAGLERVITTNGGVVVTNGDGSIAFFANCPTGCNTYVNPKGDFSTLTRHADGSGYDRAWLDGSTAGFDTQGRLTSLRDRYSNQTSFGYSASTFKLITITDPVGLTTTLVYDGNGKLDYIQDLGSRVTQVTVNGAGDLTEINDPDGVAAVRVTYDGAHVPLSYIDRRQGQWDFGYDVAGKLSQVTLPTVTVNSAPVRPVRRLLSIEGQALPPTGTGTSTNPAPRRVSDSLRAQVKESRGDSTRYAVDRFGQATRMEYRNPQGKLRIATFTLNDDGQVSHAISPEGNGTSYTWSGADLTRITDDNTGSVTDMRYETAYHQVDSVWVSGSLVQANFYGPLGRLDSTKAGSSKTSYTYDSRGRSLSVTDPQGHQAAAAYYPTGTQNTQTASAPTGDGGTGTTTFQYDGMGRSTTITDHTGRVTTRAYDPLNRVTVAVGTIADTTWFGYNDPLRTYTVTDANHQTYQAVENALGWTESRTDPRNAVERFAFDSNGNVISYTNRRNGTTTFSYDPLNRLQTATADNKTTTWSYDSLGMWIAVSNDESTDTLRNDTDDRLAEAVSVRAGVRFSLRPTYEQTGFPNGLTVERPGTWTRLLLFGHDSLFRFNYLRDFAGRGTSVAYNPDQLPNTITLPINVSGPTKLQQSVTYQASHQPYEVSFNSTNESLGRTYLYDALSRVTTASWGGASAGLSERRLEYDGAGRVSHYEDWHAVNQPVWTCPNPPSEDDCYWQDQWNWSLLRSDAYAYDKVGNPTDHGATVATGNRLAVFDGYTLTYDDDGNLIHKVKAGVVDQALTWSTLGQLSSVTTNGVVTTFGYDGFGHRVRKTTNGVTTRYLWHRDDLVMELDVNGNPVREYASYPGVDHPHSVRRSSDGAIFYYTTEGPGHVASLVDTLKNMVNRYEYTPWGDAISATEGVVQPLRYGAREYDAETGLYYNRARYYDPKLARFVSQDPIGLAGGINPYVYAQDDPVNGRDPSGLDGFDPCPSGYVYEVLEEDNGDGTVTTTESCVRTGTAWHEIPWGDQTLANGIAALYAFADISAVMEPDWPTWYGRVGHWDPKNPQPGLTLMGGGTHGKEGLWTLRHRGPIDKWPQDMMPNPTDWGPKLGTTLESYRGFYQDPTFNVRMEAFGVVGPNGTGYFVAKPTTSCECHGLPPLPLWP